MRKAVVAVVAATALVGGCGGGSGTAQPAAERWDPCSIPQQAIEATGLDPDSKDVGWRDGIVVEDWSRCRFRGPVDAVATYFFNVLSSDIHTVDEARKNDSYTQGHDVEIGERDGYQYKTQTSRSVRDCNIAIGVLGGVVVFTVSSMGTADIGADPCQLVLGHVEDLEDALPGSN